jgi:hypothetical protein
MLSRCCHAVIALWTRGVCLWDGSAVDRHRSTEAPQQLSGFADVHQGGSPIREVRVVYGHGDGTSSKRPEIGGVGILPVIPELVNHLGERICQKIGIFSLIPLTAWCIMNKGSTEMSEFDILGCTH